MRATWLRFRIRGVVLEVQASLALAALAVALATAVGLPGTLRTLGLNGMRVALGPLGLGFAVAAAFSISVALHELAHAAATRALGGRPQSMVLSALGGYTRSRDLPSDAWTRGLVEAAGPITSLTLGLVGLVAVRLLPSQPPDLRLAAFDVAELNVVLAVLNLIPASPLDGGRVLCALVGQRLGPSRANRIAVMAGRGLAVALLAVGLWRGAPALMLVAVFVLETAGAAPVDDLATVRPALRVGQVMVPARPPISPQASLDALERKLLGEHAPAALVGTIDCLVGVAGLSRLADVLPSTRALVRVQEVMASRLPVISPSTPMATAVKYMKRLRVELLPVFDSGTVGGVVTCELPRVRAHRAPRAVADRTVVVPAPSVQHCRP